MNQADTEDAAAPEVSVLIAVYNGGPYIRAAVESVLCQTFEDFEVVVVDDGSSDNTPVQLAALSDPRLRVLTLPVNGGVVAALNAGLRECRGSLIARLDADDTAMPTRLMNQVEAFRAHPKVVLCATAYEARDPDGGLIRVSAPPTTHGAAAMALMTGNCVGNSSVMFQRKAAETVGGYDADWPPLEDYDLWLRLIEVGEFVGLSTVEMRYLDNPHGVTRTQFEHQHQHAQRRTALALTALGAPVPTDWTATRPYLFATPGRRGIRDVAITARLLDRHLTESGRPRSGLYRQGLRTACRVATWPTQLGKKLQVTLWAPGLSIKGKLDREP